MATKKKPINFGSKKKEADYMAYQHSNPKAKAAAAASPGNTPVKVKGKSVKVDHSAPGKNTIKNSDALDRAKETHRPPHSTASKKKKKC